MSSKLDMSDPWNWNVDRVVQELCTTNRTWQPQSPAMLMISDPKSLEDVLRDQEVTGSVLLSEISMSILKDDFHIKALGRRSFIMSAIKQLRAKSVMYNNFAAECSPNPFTSELGISLQRLFGQLQPTNQKSPSPVPPRTPQVISNGSQIVRTSIFRQDSVPSQSETATQLVVADQSKDLLAAELSEDETVQKRRKITPTSLSRDTVVTFDKESQQNNLVPNELNNLAPIPASLIPPDIQVTDKLSGNCKGKRKRIAPTKISSITNPTLPRDTSTQDISISMIDNSNEKTDLSPEPPAMNLPPEPGVTFKDSDGRKRVIPVLQMGPALKDPGEETAASVRDEIPSKTSTNEDEISTIQKNVQTKTTCSAFLGKKKMNVDSLFYEGIPIGSEISSVDDQINFFSKSKVTTKGRCLYVHNCLRFFLRSQRHDFDIGGKHHSVKFPYSRNLVPKFKEQSFTLYNTTSDGRVVARREVNIEKSIQGTESKEFERLAIFNPMNRNLLEQVGSGIDWDYSSLEKYKYLDGGDEILPLYGDSDEDNEFDEATWKEMEDEYGEKDRPKCNLKKPPISEKEVLQTIDASISEIISSWKSKNVIKRERKAWRLWRQSRRLQNKSQQIAAAKIDLDHVQEYLEKMRARILADVWTSPLQVRRQVGSMQASLFDREELKWKISILRLKIQPDKPPQNSPRPNAKKRRNNNPEDKLEGEIISNSDTEGSVDSDLDDFIDDDEIIPTEEELHEFNFADSENDIMALSDSSLSDESIPLSNLQSRRKKISHKSSKESSTDDQLDRIGESQSLKKNQVSSKPNQSVVPTLPASDTISEPKHEENEAPTTPRSHLAQFVDLTLIHSDDNGSNLDVKSGPQNSSQVSFIDITMSSGDENPLNEKSKSLAPIDSSTNTEHNLNHLNSNISSLHFRKRVRSNQMKTSEGDENGLLTSDEIPALDNLEAISKFPYEVWQRLSDKERLLSKYFYQLIPTLCFEILQVLTSCSSDKLFAEARAVINILSSKNKANSRSDDKRTKILIRILCILEMYMDCRYYPFKSNLPEELLSKLRKTKLAEFNKFRKISIRIALLVKQNSRILRSAGSVHSMKATVDDKSSDKEEHPQPGTKESRTKPSNGSEGESSVHERSHITRKKPVHENKEARDMREQNLRRLAQQDERRKKLHAALVMANDDQAIVRSQLIINDAATEDQKFIYVNDHIAKRIKKHQVDGVRFLWNQIVTIADEQSMQGCLLAHTMGLECADGNSITLLVAIAEAACSNDPAVNSQIPESLRISRTLVLCPPSLVNNWMDELLVWVPDNMLGELRKVDTSIKSLPERLQTIIDWYQDGGVLVIGYEMFRDLINYKSKNISDAEHEQVLKWLLEGPNIIIADEAHRMKNKKAAITIAASKFRSKSRIALTGSPLANNIEEYHTMIEWVAPNYLGPIVEFRAKYVEPIQAGNYQNSTAYERRRSLKMLGVLSADLAPKVHRADMSVMKNDLPPKKEFVITVPLTDIQKEAYSIFVKSMIGGNNYTTTKLGDVTPTTVWHWLAVLSLLCNHPECFRQKLLKRKEEARNVASSPVDGSDNDESTVDLNTPLWKVGVSQELVDAESKIFEAKKSLDSVQMSNKVLLLCQILDSCKSIGDKVLVFSQSIPTLDFLENVFKRKNRNYARLDGSTAISKRQGQTKDFNNGSTDVYLISTTAGGLGLNLQGANRVVIFDFKFNPIMEEQAIGRAYRIGQKKPTFIYRFIAGGTFEDSIHNKTVLNSNSCYLKPADFSKVFKTQLASRVVDKKNPIAWANKKTSEFLFEPKEVPQKDLSEFEGMDPGVLDRLLQIQKRKDQRGIPRTICSIVQTDTFAVDDDDKLTPDEEMEVQSELQKTRLFRANPQAFQLQQIAEQQLFRRQQLQQIPMPFQKNNLTFPSSMGQYQAVNTTSSCIGSPIPVNTFVMQNIVPKVVPIDGPFFSTPETLKSVNSMNTSLPKMTSSKAQSPVAGANTKVAASKPETIDLEAPQNFQLEKPTIPPTMSTLTQTNSSELTNSEVICLDASTKKFSSKTSHGFLSSNASEQVLNQTSNEMSSKTSSELSSISTNHATKEASNEMTNEISGQEISEGYDSKCIKNNGKEWEMTRRYRESRASHVPDYGPIAAHSQPKPISEPVISKLQVQSSDKFSKQPQIPLGPSHSQRLSQNQSQNPTLNTKLRGNEDRNEKHDINETRRTVTKENDIKRSQKKETESNQTPKFISKPNFSRADPVPRRPQSPSPSYSRRSPPSHRRFSPSPYRRPLPPSHTPTGPRNSNFRRATPRSDNDERGRSFRGPRGESYRPSPYPSHRYSPYN